MSNWNNEVAFLDATAQAALVRNGELKAVELVEAAIANIESLNPHLNAVITPMYDQALAAAIGDLPAGPFTGVPLLLKDLIACFKGVRTSSGCRFMRDFIPDYDSEIVRRFKKAGFIVAGKTNTPELGILPTTEPRLFGATRNPWNLKRTAGGSSGGSAAAVAAGMVAIAHGGDGGGSIRIPASCCGVFGMKPTRGRNPMGPGFGDRLGGLVAEHVLTRSVRDSAAALDAISGPDIGDPYCAPHTAHSFHSELESPPERLRIAFTTRTLLGIPVHADCAHAVADAAKLCEDLGHSLVEDSPGFDAESLNKAFTMVWAVGCAAAIEGFAMKNGCAPTRDELEPLTWALYRHGQKVTGAQYLHAIQGLQAIARDIARFFLEYDVWLTPTTAEPAVPLGSFDGSLEDPLAGLDRAGTFVPFTPICNVTGQPAMSVPLYWNAEGLPVGTHFVGRFGDEGALLRLASQLESARPWASHRPSVADWQ